MKRLGFILLLTICFLCGKSQTVVDALNITPNPFQKRTAAYYSYTQNDTVSLNVYNRWGQLIVPLRTNSVMPSGVYQDSIIMDAFPDDVYIVILTLGVRKSINKQIIKSSTASINEIQNPLLVKTYPNPVSSILYFENETGEFENSQIEIADALGQTILKRSFSNSLDVSEFSQGFYSLKISKVNKQTYYSRFIKD